MRVDWLLQARRNLEQEADYLAVKNPAAAHDMLQTIRSAVCLLAQQPGAGRPGRVPGTRELVIQRYPYLIPYRVRGDVLEVLRVFHTSRKPPEKW
ncbi:MAG: type II toxin-antitoxin system RelE/ParE family toxin [Gammaproteobacteria bacterium]|nr:type II toxin-antitoxin system RelE/ParE family toxin [Gammaproteobacteria bacterium]